METRSASFRMYLTVTFALCSSFALGCVLGECDPFSNSFPFDYFIIFIFVTIAWSGTALETLKKDGSQPQIHTHNVSNHLETSEEDVEYETWISSCITLGALAGSFLSGNSSSS